MPNIENLLIVKRKERCLTVSNCADLVGVSRQIYYKYEKLDSTPKISIMIKISKLLNIPLGTMSKLFEKEN